jgi:formamidopyrimidine-DNA glycosylase
MSNPMKNILSITPKKDKELESTSSLVHAGIGICPKCKTPFTTAVANGEEVYFCVSCRVTEPLAL